MGFALATGQRGSTASPPMTWRLLLHLRETSKDIDGASCLSPSYSPSPPPYLWGHIFQVFSKDCPSLSHEHPQGLASKGNLLAVSGTYRTFYTGMLAHTRPSRACEHFRWFLLTSFKEEIVSLVSPRRTWCSLELISLQPQLSGGPRKSTDVMCDLPSSPRWGEGHCPADPYLLIPHWTILTSGECESPDRNFPDNTAFMVSTLCFMPVTRICGGSVGWFFS